MFFKQFLAIIILPLSITTVLSCSSQQSSQSSLSVARSGVNYDASANTAILWHKISMERFCQLMSCVSSLSEENEKIFHRLNEAMNTIHHKLGFQNIPKPDLVMINAPQQQRHLLRDSGGKKSGISRPNNFFFVISAQSYPFQIKSKSLPPKNSKRSRLNTFILAIDDFNIGALNNNHILKMNATRTNNYINHKKITHQQFATLLNELFHGQYQFNIHNPENKPVIMVDDINDSPFQRVSFHWQAREIYFERKFNKIVLMHNHPFLYLEDYDQLLNEMLWQLYNYYGFDQRTSVPVLTGGLTTTFVSDKNNGRRGGGENKIFDQINVAESRAIFRPYDHKMKHPDLQFSPAIFELIFILDLFTIAQVIASHDIGDLTFMNTNEFKKYFYSFNQAITPFYRQIKSSSIWQTYVEHYKQSNAEQTHQLLDLPIILFKIIADMYDQISPEFIKAFEFSINKFYEGQYFPYDKIFSPEVIRHLAKTSLLKLHSIHNIDEHIIQEMALWIIRKNTQNFTYHMHLFSYHIEELNQTYNQRRQLLFKNHAYPYSKGLERDETIVHYLSLLGKSEQPLIDYILRDVSDIDRARCLLRLNLTDNLLDYYDPNLFFSAHTSPAFACARVLNIKKEVLRHQR
ncbi:MAG: hypothetical protein OXC40_02100 [Proteobacteria bacterium]|nr:hypothetical protein [Pseudomonadota bacterium]